MTVRELIDRLNYEDSSKRVVVDGYESGFDEVEKISYVTIKKNPDKGDSEKNDRWWDGEFESSDSPSDEAAIVLPRKR